MTGGEQIAQVLKQQGVKFIFTLCGGHISPILVGAKKTGIRIIDVRQEATAVFAADAVSRLTGVPGVAAVTAGPGLTNSITAIKNAQMAQSPMVLLGGAPATILKGRGALQDIDHLKLVESITKWSVSLTQDCDIIPILEEAFDVAKSGIPGPVYIECPLDLLYDQEMVREWYIKKTGQSPGIVKKVTDWYLRRHVDKLFACSGKSLDAAKKEDVVPFLVNPKDVSVVLKKLKTAKKPVMIIGSQATLRPEQIDKLSAQLKKSGIPLFLTGMARGLTGADHPLQFRHNRTQALKEADLIIIAGMPCDFRLNYGLSISKKAFHIAINRSKADLSKNKKPNLGILADPCTFLLELTSSDCCDPQNIQDWIKTLKTREAEKENKISDAKKVRTEYINPLVLCDHLEDSFDSDSILIGDGGDFIATVSYITKPKKPLSWLDPGPFGTLGIGAGFALAAKLVRPEAEVWLLYGDGACGYGLIEFDTFVRHDLPVIAVIGNDAGWTQIARDQIEVLHDDVATKLKYSNYHAIADALGAKGFLLEKEEDIKAILQSAKKESQSGHPVLINAFIGKTDFRKGSISI